MLTYTLVNAATAASFSASQPLDLGDLKDYSMGIVVSGSDVAGTFTLECSNDKTTWVTVADSDQAITTSQEVFYDVRDANYRYARLAFSYTSGTGTITVTAIVKQNFVTGM